MSLRPFAMAVIGVLLGLGAELACAASWSADKARRADAITEHFLRPRGMAPIRPPGLSVAIGHNGRLLYAAGSGSAGLGRVATEDTVYRVGSITKQFTAAAVLRMIDNGALAPRTSRPITLDTDISDILDGTDHWHVAGQNTITVRSLLNMTSNLPNFTRRPPEEIDPWGTVHARSLMQALKKMKPSGWPGSFEYSNTSYFILAEALEAAQWPDRQPHSYEQVLQDEVFAPVGMPSTDFTGYRINRMAIPAYNRRAAFSNRDWLKGSGDVASTVTDIFAWNAALMDDKVLARGLRQEMFREGGRVTPTIYYGMGWFIDQWEGWNRHFHSGSVPGFTSYNCILQKRLGGEWISVTILTNSDGVEGLEDLASDLSYLVAND